MIMKIRRLYVYFFLNNGSITNYMGLIQNHNRIYHGTVIFLMIAFAAVFIEGLLKIHYDLTIKMIPEAAPTEVASGMDW